MPMRREIAEIKKDIVKTIEKPIKITRKRNARMINIVETKGNPEISMKGNLSKQRTTLIRLKKKALIISRVLKGKLERRLITWKMNSRKKPSLRRRMSIKRDLIVKADVQALKKISLDIRRNTDHNILKKKTPKEVKKVDFQCVIADIFSNILKSLIKCISLHKANGSHAKIVKAALKELVKESGNANNVNGPFVLNAKAKDTDH